MDAELIEAYRQTLYCVGLSDGPQECLRVGEKSTWLDRQLMLARQGSAIFITAENPRSKRLDKEENCQRTAALRDSLSIAGYQFLMGYGIGQTSDWPPEESFLVLGATREAGLDLASKFEQNAFLFAAAGEAVELVFVDP
jgi:hypothetical protein